MNGRFVMHWFLVRDRWLRTFPQHKRTVIASRYSEYKKSRTLGFASSYSSSQVKELEYVARLPAVRILAGARKGKLYRNAAGVNKPFISMDVPLGANESST